ncbi:MAG: IS91 family transposase [Acidobacteria bacterium]|nr:IS91 family transposase [Acidobacteriota bacterium]
MADVFRSYGAEYLRKYGSSTSAQQQRVLRELSLCRTAALGGHKKKCNRCGHEQIWYNSCRNRHCPKCQAGARAEWFKARELELLDVPYFHLVFTLPDEIGPLALQNPRRVYGILFRAAAETLLTLARDPQHLGASIGFLVVLHTWGQNLHHHPHVHAVVPGGGLSLDGQRWLPTRSDFFLPVRALSRLFRGKFLSYLQQAFHQGKLSFHGQLQSLAPSACWKRWRKNLYSKDWVLYAKPPFGGPQQVLKYLARYTHRVAISNQRLLSLHNGRVAFRWKNYAQGNQQRTMVLEALEFIRRFLLHVLPKGFVRIRYYGFLANGERKKKLALIRTLLAPNQPTPASPAGPAEPGGTGEQDAAERCPQCRQGWMIEVEHIPPTTQGASQPRYHDTS